MTVVVYGSIFAHAKLIDDGSMKNSINSSNSSSATSLLSRGTLINGAVSVSLDDSWTGRSLLEALGRVAPLGGNFGDVSVCRGEFGWNSLVFGWRTSGQ